jgi:hypothetical protein
MDKPWLDKKGRPTDDPKERAREFIRRLEVVSGMATPVNCPVCGYSFGWDTREDTDREIHAAFATIQNQLVGTQMPVLLICCQRCPFLFTFDVGRNGFGDLPERPEKDADEAPYRSFEEWKQLPLVKRLREVTLGATIAEPIEVQLLHIMIRSERWADHERPENYPVWRPEDPEYHFDHFFHKKVSPERAEKAFRALQKKGLVRKSGSLGYCLVEDEEGES